MRIVLASGSAARRQMLQAAGLEFAVAPAAVDEDAIRRSLAGDVHPREVALALASAKAASVAADDPDAIVIGADQVLELQGTIINKSPSMRHARATLQRLAGRRHHLHSAVALAQGAVTDWSDVASATLTMRQLSPAFIDRYLTTVGDGILSCVGCYQIEGVGIQLFESVEGDHFTIMGLPLLALLGELRRRGALAA